MFVPSLSWQNDHLNIYKWHRKRTRFLTDEAGGERHVPLVPRDVPTALLRQDVQLPCAGLAQRLAEL